MGKEKKRPVAIKIKGGSNITVKNNTGIGDMDLLHAEDVHSLDADGNVLVTPENNKTNIDKRWYEKPIGIVSLMVVAGLIVAFAAYYFGWK